MDPRPALALFDLDDTLVRRRTSFIDTVTALCLEHGFGVEIRAWMLSELADRANADDFVRLRHDYALDCGAGQLWGEFVDRMANAVSCDPAVLQGLERLRADEWRIGIVANGASDVQRAKIGATGLADLVDGVAVSGDIDVRKPDARLFALAAARCHTGLSAEAWMTGDSPYADIAGGHQAGIRTIWVRGRSWPGGFAAPHHTVDGVTGAISYLLRDGCRHGEAGRARGAR
ncbi:HAD family hydrolase [Actinacidiphila glaucinigra]|uniref:HAD family hydrolase n=1 Tax=Actinacidiphila glaucinigra TaxID=235986 RepID=UPI00379F7D9D